MTLIAASFVNLVANFYPSKSVLMTSGRVGVRVMVGVSLLYTSVMP